MRATVVEYLFLRETHAAGKGNPNGIEGTSIVLY